MRHLNTRGLTLVELMIALVIGVLLITAAAPSLSDYINNSRLREGGHLLLTEALTAQSEAIKRNAVVRLATSGSQVQVIDRSVPATPVTLRTRTAAPGVGFETKNIDFDAQGRVTPLADQSIDLDSTAVTCSSEQRCPRLRIDGGGGVRLCGDKLSCS